MTYRIFISYSQDDFLARGRKIRNYLAKVIPDSYVYIDQDKEKGENWREKNDSELLKSDLMILVITPAVLHSKEVKREIKLAKENKVRILPCKDDNLDMTWEEIPLNLGIVDGIRFGEAEVLRTKLYKEIKKILRASRPESKTELVSSKGQGVIDVMINKSKFELKFAFEDGYAGILKTNVDRELCSLILEIDCNLPSKMTVRLPRGLIDAKTLAEDAVFYMLADGDEIPFIESKSTDKERWLTFTCLPDMDSVEIIGTEILGISPGKRSGKEHIISLPRDSSIPENEKLANPVYLKVSNGDTVTWINDDLVAHTITSGTIDGGPDGHFDSSLFMSGNSFSVTFEKPGIYKYFCMVHPWKECIIEVE